MRSFLEVVSTASKIYRIDKTQLEALFYRSLAVNRQGFMLIGEAGTAAHRSSLIAHRSDLFAKIVLTQYEIFLTIGTVLEKLNQYWR